MSLAISAQQWIHTRDAGAGGTTSDPDLPGEIIEPDTRPSLATDGLLVLIVGGAFVAFYFLFKAVAILAGLPFP